MENPSFSHKVDSNGKEEKSAIVLRVLLQQQYRSKYGIVLKTNAFVLALTGKTKHSDEQHSKLQKPLTSP